MLTRSTKPMQRGAPLQRRTPLKSSWLKQTAGLIPSPFKKKRSRKRAPTAAERAYMGHVAALGCAVCRRLGHGATPAIVHHQRTGQGKMRASHYRTAPLCPRHHQDSGVGVHDMGRPQFAEMYGFSEVELIEETRALLVAYLPVSEQGDMS